MPAGAYGGSLYEQDAERHTPRSAQNGGIPAAATLAGSRRSTAPAAVSPQLRPRSEGGGGGVPQGSPRSAPPPRSPQGGGAAGRLPPRSPRSEKNADMNVGRMPALQLPPTVRPVQSSPSKPSVRPEAEGAGAGVKAASAWTAALDAMAMARRKKGNPAPAHLESSSARSAQSTPENGSSGSRQAAAAAAHAAAEKLRLEQAQQLSQEDVQRLKKLAADVSTFAATDMAKVAAFVRRAKTQLPCDLNETTLRQVCSLLV